MGLKSSLQGRTGRGRVQQEVGDPFLGGQGQTHDLCIFDGAFCRVLRGRDHEISDAPPLNLSGPFDYGERLRRYARLNAL